MEISGFLERPGRNLGVRKDIRGRDGGRDFKRIDISPATNLYALEHGQVLHKMGNCFSIDMRTLTAMTVLNPVLRLRGRSLPKKN